MSIVRDWVIANVNPILQKVKDIFFSSMSMLISLEIAEINSLFSSKVTIFIVSDGTI